RRARAPGPHARRRSRARARQAIPNWMLPDAPGHVGQRRRVPGRGRVPWARARLRGTLQGADRQGHRRRRPAGGRQVLPADFLRPGHRRRHQVTALTLTALLALLLAGPSVAGAASFTLEPRQQSDALRVGAQSITRDSFDTERRVATPAGDSVTVMTPCH